MSVPPKIEYLKPNKKINTAHIAEGPGGFIQCVVENLERLKVPIKAIHAMTLRPTRSHIPGWRRSANFLKKNPQIQLEYGEDDTGNILNHANQMAFVKKAEGAHLFTADGGFDFSVDYNLQEFLAQKLIFSEVISFSNTEISLSEYL